MKPIKQNLNINWDPLKVSLNTFPLLNDFIIIIYFFEDKHLVHINCPYSFKNELNIYSDCFSKFINDIIYNSDSKSLQYKELLFSSEYYKYKDEKTAIVLFGSKSESDGENELLFNDQRKEFTGPVFELIKYFIDSQLSKINNEQTKIIEIPTAKEDNNEIIINSEPDIYKIAFKQAHNAMAIANTIGNIIDINKSWADLHGYQSTEELLNKNIRIFHTTEQLEHEVIPSIKKTELENSTIGEIGHIDKSGHIIPTLMTSTKLRNANNETFGYLGIATDISKKLNYEKQLINIFESLAFGIMIIDIESLTIIEINTAALLYLKQTKKQVLGHVCHQYVCPATNGNCPVKDLKENITNSERLLVRKDGNSIPILKTVSEIEFRGRKAYLESFTSIEDLKKAQLEAEESARLKASFLSNISHEIRTPLNHILGFTTLILEDADISDTYKNYLQIVQRSGTNLLNIMDDIVTISKIEAGYRHVHESDFNLKTLTYSIFTKYQSELLRTGKKVKMLLDFSLTPEQHYLQSDEIKVKQILDHLINNAIKFTEQGFISISVKIKDKFVVYSIKDTGRGIGIKDIDAIFDSFRKIEYQNSRVHDGTGIGLTLCKSLSQLIGGNIRVESVLDKGSTFHFSFPFKSSYHKRDQVKVVDIPDLRGKTILVVEDDRINYIYVKTLIEKTKANVIWKQNGLEATQFIADGNEPNMILMDMQMPLMDGYEATIKIRNINTSIPIIAQTANAMADDREKCLSLGCNEYTTKPLQQDVLFWYFHYYFKINTEAKSK